MKQKWEMAITESNCALENQTSRNSLQALEGVGSKVSYRIW